MQVQTTIAKHPFLLDSAEVTRKMRGELPDPIVDHYVVVGGTRYPPKQVIVTVTGLDRADFTTHQSRRVLSRLGFVVGRRSRPLEVQPPEGRKHWPHGGREAEALRPFRGRWVAQRGLEVLVAAGAPEEVIAWLERHNQQADAVFRVPEDSGETEVIGLA